MGSQVAVVIAVQPQGDVPVILPFRVGVADSLAAYVEGLAASFADLVGQSPATGAAGCPTLTHPRTSFRHRKSEG